MEGTYGGNDQRTPRARPSVVIVRLLVFGILWLALTEGDRYNWWFGVVIVAIATATSLMMLPAETWRPMGIVRFVPFFARQSVAGGVDVARRALAPGMPVEPGFVEVPFRLPEGNTRVALAIIVGLLPGTVSVEVGENTLRLHAIDRNMEIDQTVRTCEARIADVRGIDLPNDA